MRNAGLKSAISPSESKLLLFLGMCALLAGMATLAGRHDGSFAPLLVMIGLFGVCLGAVKRMRHES
ncbi:MAG TPA: hypothetical protein VFB04_11605 [Terriglobales bacterium]|nr:hypothetical protein [Terriglobales bacterium]